MTEGVLAFRIPDAVKASGLSRTVLYELFQSGAIVPRKQGSRTIILASDLKRYLENLPAAPSVTKHRKNGEALSAA